jgi:hypothetical protein
VERGESPFSRPSSFKVSSGIKRTMVNPAKAVARLDLKNTWNGHLERQRVLMTGSTASQDLIGLKRALQLGVILTIIVLAVVVSWPQ